MFEVESVRRIMDLLAMYEGMAESTRRMIAKARSEGIDLTQCPRCARVCHESELYLIDGELMCVGERKETHCAVRS